MRPLVFWTSSDGHSLHQIIRPALQRLKQQPAYRYAPVGDSLPALAEDELCLALGKRAIEILGRHSVVHKNRTAASLRGTLHNYLPKDATAPATFLVSYDPYEALSDPALIPDIEWDVQLTARYAATGSLAATLGEYRWVQDFSNLIDSIEAKFKQTGKPVPVAGDIETLGLSPYMPKGRIVAIGFTDTEGKADLLYLADLSTPEHAKRVRDQMNWLLNSPKIRLRGANFKFDLNWILVKWKIECSNYSMDTLLVGSLLNENRKNSLKNHVKHYVPTLGGYDDEITQADLEGMHLVPRDKMLRYLGGDVDGTLRVSNAMLGDLMVQPDLARFYKVILHPGARTFARVEREGIVVNQEKYRALRADLVTAIEQADKQALDLLPARIRHKFADNLSITRPAVMKDYFFGPMGLNLKPKQTTAKSGEPSTAKAHLEMFETVPEAKAMCSALSAGNQARKSLSTYVDGFLKHLHPDSRFRPNYFLHNGDNDWGDHEGGANTGRLSAIAPAVQTIPSRTEWGKRIRSCLEAPPGHLIIGCDYDQGELKLAACIADETTMIQVYQDGLDLHTKTGARAAGLEYEDMIALQVVDPKQFKLLRYRAKAYNFGLIYGMSAEGLQAYAWVGYRLRLTLQEATEARDAFFATYTRLPDWHKHYKALGRSHKQVTTPLGRIRHLPHIASPERFVASKAERQAVNAPIQSLLSDIMVWAMAEVDRIYPDYPLIASIHDAGYWVVPEDGAHDAAHRITEVMSNLPFEQAFGWSPVLQFTASAEIGPDLGSLVEQD